MNKEKIVMSVSALVVCTLLVFLLAHYRSQHHSDSESFSTTTSTSSENATTANTPRTPLIATDTSATTVDPSLLDTITSSTILKNLPNTFSPRSSNKDLFGISMIYPTAPNGRVWYSSWSTGEARTIRSGERDPYNGEFIMRGNGTGRIDGKGVITLMGDSPRMYVYDPSEQEKWGNVEVTVYAKRGSESDSRSSQGFVIGARSEHQDATEDTACLGGAYYGRLLYDGRAVFQKEIIHEELYSTNKPSEENLASWQTSDKSLPRHSWIGLKFIVRTNPDNSVTLELYRDLTNGANGGTWEKIAQYTDDGHWEANDADTDVQRICGHAATQTFSKPGTSVFIRNDSVTDVEYKDWSIREIAR